jgi:hypothetical protein
VNRTKRLQAKTALKRGTGLKQGTALKRDSQLKRGARLAPVSGKRRQENRRRRAMVAEMWPERPLCVVYVMSQANPDVIPGEVIGQCGRWADDVHEPLTRARGGSISDPENAVVPCRACHDAITFSPESELVWAYEAGLLVHSWAATAAAEGATP